MPVSRVDLSVRFGEHLSSARLFDPPGRVLVAVSGGADSMALLYLLAATAEDLDLELVVGPADHGIHPDTARRLPH